ncbi:hypothetical protein CCP3SC15_1550001 [Gammaproteobacteria bacterium]
MSDNIREIIDASRDAGLSRRIEDHERRMVTLEETSGLVVEIHTALIGTMEKPGLVREIKDNSEFISGCKKRHDNEIQVEQREKSSFKVKMAYGAVTVGGMVVVWLMGRAGIFH